MLPVRDLPQILHIPQWKVIKVLFAFLELWHTELSYFLSLFCVANVN